MPSTKAEIQKIKQYLDKTLFSKQIPHIFSDTIELLNGVTANQFKKVTHLKQSYHKITHEIAPAKLDSLLRAIFRIGGSFGLNSINRYNKLREHYISKFTPCNKFNLLILAWVFKSLPLTVNLISLEQFKEYVHQIHPTVPFDLEIIPIFYRHCSDHWSKLENPSVEDIRSTCLKIVAMTVNSLIKYHNESFGIALYCIFDTLLNKNVFIVVDEVFVTLVREYIGDDWIENKHMKKATLDFYTFAKRLVLVDLLTKEMTLTTVVKTFARNKFDRYCEKYMNIIEEKVDNLYFQNLIDPKHEKSNGHATFNPEQNLNWYRLKKLIAKIYQTRGLAKNKAIEYIQKSEVYSKLDSSLQITKSMEKIRSKSEDVVLYFNAKVVNPAVNLVTYAYSSGKDLVMISIDFVQKPDFDQLKGYLTTKYSEVKDMTLEIYDKTVKIALGKESFSKYGHQLKTEMEKLLNEIKTMDLQKAKDITNSIYHDALKALKVNRRLELTI